MDMFGGPIWTVRVSIANKSAVFNLIILMDLMSIDYKSIEYIVCKDNLSSAALFMSGESSTDIWSEYVKVWVIP